MSSLAYTLRRFAHLHDEMPAFHAGYLVVTFLFAALLNLGAFALLIAAHMSLDYVKYSEVHGFPLAKTLKAMFFESLVDLTLLSIGLVFGVYLHHAAGVIAVSGLLRAEETLLLGLGTLVPKLEVLHHTYADFFNIKRHMATMPKEFAQGWTRTDTICVLIALSSVLLVLLAPALLHLDLVTFGTILRDQMMPL